MIKIQVNKNSIIVEGHSGYDVEGKDIVCAGVSSITTTSVNAILRFDEDAIKYEASSGYLKIEILKHNDIVDTLIENMVSMLKEMEEKYSKYIKVNEGGALL